ncbi:MAG: N-acetyl-gamma-glutamyl-phosphate reductase [Lysobacteraceae bacterium]|nr:MAG: N-acetyl-gamma-glutamyl-phosphate reductase [Xanthomonadaceae bacterium]
MSAPIRLGLVGARGYVGTELIKLVAAHPRFTLAFVSSRERDGQRLADHEPSVTDDLRYVNLNAEQAAGQGADALVLALPNGMAAPFVAQVDAQAPATVVLDLSADYRFNQGWHYGLPEITRGRAHGAHRISNPGCYATAMQLAIAPMLDQLAAPVQCFGVSGYSGAGTTPSDKNNPEKLRDNLVPYSLTGHVHESEVTRQLGHAVEFIPHVAPFFRGIMLTANLHLSRSHDLDEVRETYLRRYADEPMVQVQYEAPWVSQIAGRHHAEVGGFTLSAHGRRLVVVSTLDNLLKGAATQALQNLNLAFGLPETMGIPT